VTQSTNSKMPQIQEPRKFFIIYRRDSGWDFAKHLHDSLHERGVDVFLDTEDLKEGLSKGEWKKQRDKAIEEAEAFVFIVTHNASKAPEIKYEIRKARDKDLRVFIHDHIWDIEEELRIKINKDCIHLKDFQVRRFQTKEELLREVADSTLITRIFTLTVKAVDERGRELRVPFRIRRIK